MCPLIDVLNVSVLKDCDEGKDWVELEHELKDCDEGKDWVELEHELKDCYEGEDCVEHGAWVGDEHLLFVHVEGGHEELGGRQSAPDNHQARAQGSKNA